MIMLPECCQVWINNWSLCFADDCYVSKDQMKRGLKVTEKMAEFCCEIIFYVTNSYLLTKEAIKILKIHAEIVNAMLRF